jgi:tetratricopeptide (TPR) repeat protein
MADISIDELCHCAAVSSLRNGGMVAENARAHFDCGTAWAQFGAYEQALEAWRQALRLAPDLADAHAAMGSVYMTLGCWQEAVRSYQQAILAAPYLLESYYGLGSAYGRLGDYSRAIEAYEQAFQLLPTEHDQNTEADRIGLESPTPDALRLDTDAFQDRLRSDSAGFDFSALLSSPTARRQAVRQERGIGG